jgi:hypothetical protein
VNLSRHVFDQPGQHSLDFGQVAIEAAMVHLALYRATELLSYFPAGNVVTRNKELAPRTCAYPQKTFRFGKRQISSLLQLFVRIGV